MCWLKIPRSWKRWWGKHQPEKCLDLAGGKAWLILSMILKIALAVGRYPTERRSGVMHPRTTMMAFTAFQVAPNFHFGLPAQRARHIIWKGVWQRQACLGIDPPAIRGRYREDV